MTDWRNSPLRLTAPMAKVDLASYANVLTGSSRNHSSPTRGEERLRDEP